MKKILILLISLGSFVSISMFSKVEAATLSIVNDYTEVRELFSNDNIKDMTSSYFDTYLIKWNATEIIEIEDIYDEYLNHIAYLVIFDIGYLVYTHEMGILDLSATGYPYYYKSTYNSNSDNKLIYKTGSFYYENNQIIQNNNINTLGDYDSNIFFPLYDQYYNDDFKINSSMVKIPYFKDAHDSSDWGNYEPITFSYFGSQSGSVLCAMSLMYTIKVNGGVNLTPTDRSWQSLRDELYYYTDFDYLEDWFVDSYTLQNGVNKYLSDTYGYEKYEMLAVYGVDALNPSVTLYGNNNGDSANFCLRVGHAQEPYFWVFLTYYDIIMANCHNFFTDKSDVPTYWDRDDLGAFYIVDAKYRGNMFQFFEGNTLLK